MYFVLLYINIVIILAKVGPSDYIFRHTLFFSTVLIELYVYIFSIFNQHYKQ